MDYVAQAIKERLRVLWFPLLLRRLRASLEKEYQGTTWPAVWRPIQGIELPAYRLSTDKRMEEKQLLEKLVDRTDQSHAWGDEPNFEKIYKGDLRRFRRRLQKELGLDRSLELYKAFDNHLRQQEKMMEMGLKMSIKMMKPKKQNNPE